MNQPTEIKLKRDKQTKSKNITKKRKHFHIKRPHLHKPHHVHMYIVAAMENNTTTNNTSTIEKASLFRCHGSFLCLFYEHVNDHNIMERGNLCMRDN